VITQDLVDPRSLNPNPAPVYQPDVPQPGLVRRAHVFVHHRRDIARQESVQVERLFDRNPMHVYPWG
jgi:hypothetical protein